MNDMRAILWNYSFLIAQMETLQEIADNAGNLEAAATIKEATDEMKKRYTVLELHERGRMTYANKQST